jgi:hypothetical protein
MNLLDRFARYVKDEVWRPADSRVIVRKRRPGLGWTVNLAALRRSAMRRRANR